MPNIMDMLRTDPDLNMAALKFGAGLMQPGASGTDIFGKALSGSVDFLQKARGERGARTQQKEMHEQDIGLRKQQFGIQEAGAERRHQETMMRLQKSYEAALRATDAGEARSIDKALQLGNDFAEQEIQLGMNNPRFATPRGRDIYRKSKQNEILSMFGHPVKNFLPYGPEDVAGLANLAGTNRQAFLLAQEEHTRAFGPRFKLDVQKALVDKAKQKPAAPGGAPSGPVQPSVEREIPFADRQNTILKRVEQLRSLAALPNTPPADKNAALMKAQELENSLKLQRTMRGQYSVQPSAIQSQP